MENPRKGRPITRRVKAGEAVMISFKLDGGLVRRLDRLARSGAVARPGLATTRTDIIRVALTEWLDRHARERKV